MTRRQIRGVAAALFAALALVASCGADGGGKPAPADKKVLMDPAADQMKQEAPADFRARFETTKGAFAIAVDRKLSPRGADRFYNLVRHGYYNGNKFFRVLPGFIVQWGMNGDPEVNGVWSEARILDDPVQASNERGTVTFAKPPMPNGRSTHLFINLGNNANLDRQGFAAFGRVVEGMEVVEAINAEYGQKPDQGQIAARGNAYLEETFPNLDAILSATIDD